MGSCYRTKRGEMMVELLVGFIISILVAYGLAVLLVEKGDEFPVDKVASPLRLFLFWNFGPKVSDVLDCTICSSFWTALIADAILCYISFTYFNTFYFLWPLTGFAASGISWTIYEFLNAIDPRD